MKNQECKSSIIIQRHNNWNKKIKKIYFRILSEPCKYLYLAAGVMNKKVKLAAEGSGFTAWFEEVLKEPLGDCVKRGN